jgi:hypothetical protein
VAPPSSGPPQGPAGADTRDVRFAIPVSLYPAQAAQSGIDAPLDALVRLDNPASWFIPAFITGVPGLLLIILILGNVLLGVSWLPNVGRLLGPEPDEPADDDHLWWAAGKPLR